MRRVNRALTERRNVFRGVDGASQYLDAAVVKQIQYDLDYGLQSMQPDRTLGPLFGARSAIPAAGLSPTSKDADLLDERRAR